MKSNVKYLTALLAAGMFLGAPALANTWNPASVGAQVAAAGSMTMTAMDHQFVMKAAHGGNAEVSLGRLALKNSSNPTVKSFARKMIADHTANNAKLASVVASMGGAAPPTGLSSKDAAMRTKLASMAGSAFDTNYMKGQVAGHQKMAALMQKEASAGANASLKSFAAATLPTVQMHLSLAQKDMGMMSGAQ